MLQLTPAILLYFLPFLGVWFPLFECPFMNKAVILVEIPEFTLGLWVLIPKPHPNSIQPWERNKWLLGWF